MPLRALILWVVGVFFIAANMQFAEAQYEDRPPQLPSWAEPVATVNVNPDNCCFAPGSTTVPSDGTWHVADHISGPGMEACAIQMGDGSKCRVHPSDPTKLQTQHTNNQWYNATVTRKCLNGSNPSYYGTSLYAYCGAGNGWQPPDCAGMEGHSMMCQVPTSTEYDALPTSGCQDRCQVSAAESGGGITVIFWGGSYNKQYRFTGESCSTASFCETRRPGKNDDPPGVPPGGQNDLGNGNSIGDDGEQGTYEDGEFNKPPPGGCSYSDDGVWSCDDDTGVDGGDGSVGTDGTGDGSPDDEYSFGTNWEDVPHGTTIVDPDTGQTLGTAIDQDGDGFTDGIDTDGDGDIDVDDPTDPGGGQDNNGDGKVDASDGDNDGDGNKGQAGDCVDDPDTEENECGGTGGKPGEASVAGLSCDEEPSCQPAKDDIQGQLWCAQLKLQHKVSCQYHAPGAADNPDSLFADKPEDDGSELFEEINLEEEGPGLSTGVVTAGGMCFEDLPLDVMGGSFVVPMSSLCPYFGAAGYIILLVGYMVAAFVVYRGVFA